MVVSLTQHNTHRSSRKWPPQLSGQRTSGRRWCEAIGLARWVPVDHSTVRILFDNKACKSAGSSSAVHSVVTSVEVMSIPSVIPFLFPASDHERIPHPLLMRAVREGLHITVMEQCWMPCAGVIRTCPTEPDTYSRRAQGTRLSTRRFTRYELMLLERRTSRCLSHTVTKRKTDC